MTGDVDPAPEEAQRRAVGILHRTMMEGDLLYSRLCRAKSDAESEEASWAIDAYVAASWVIDTYVAAQAMRAQASAAALGPGCCQGGSRYEARDDRGVDQMGREIIRRPARST